MKPPLSIFRWKERTKGVDDLTKVIIVLAFPWILLRWFFYDMWRR